MANGYQYFLMVQLAIAKGVIETELEYDTQWETGVALYAEFGNSKFNDPNEAEYECIVNFLNDKLIPDQTFALYADVIEVNRYDYTVKAKSMEEAKAKLAKHLKSTTPHVSDVNKELGIECHDYQMGWNTIEVKEIFPQTDFTPNDDLPF